MSGLNKVMLIGNLGQDPEIKTMTSGNSVANLSIATSESWNDKNTGQKVEKTEWHRVVMFNRLAELARDYLNKGSKIYIEGKLQTRKWQDSDGNDRYTTEIVAGSMQFLGGKQDVGGGYSAPRQPESSQTAPAQAEGADGFDDDIPF